MALALWVAVALAYPILLARARRRGPEAVLEARRRFHRLLAVEGGAFLALLLTGLLAMRLHGWGIGYPRWLGLKLGLVAFLLIPLEAIHAYAAHAFIARGLRLPETEASLRELERGASMQEMVWALTVPLGGIALPLLLWLSFARPF